MGWSLRLLWLHKGCYRIIFYCDADDDSNPTIIWWDQKWLTTHAVRIFLLESSKAQLPISTFSFQCAQGFSFLLSLHRFTASWDNVKLHLFPLFTFGFWVIASRRQGLLLGWCESLLVVLEKSCYQGLNLGFHVQSMHSGQLNYFSSPVFLF